MADVGHVTEPADRVSPLPLRPSAPPPNPIAKVSPHTWPADTRSPCADIGDVYSLIAPVCDVKRPGCLSVRVPVYMWL